MPSRFVLLVLALVLFWFGLCANAVYPPRGVGCPQNSGNSPIIRNPDVLDSNGNSNLHLSEQAYIEKRWQKSNRAIRDFVARQNLQGMDLDSLFYDQGSKDKRNKINAAVAIPGGGYKAVMLGGGALQNMDGREKTSPGRLSGLLQGMSHMTGVSGGAWLVGSLYLNDFQPVSQLREIPNQKSPMGVSNMAWKFDTDLSMPGSSTNQAMMNLVKFKMDIMGKMASGFPVTLLDFYGRMLSYQLIEDPDSDARNSWSSIASQPSFQAGEGPLPIITSIGHDNTSGWAVNSIVYEITPWELGSYSNAVKGFVPLKYLGSNLNNGQPSSSMSCVSGYDNSGFMMAASSNIFNSVLYWVTVNDGTFIATLAKAASQFLDQTRVDLAVIQPNPFMNWSPPNLDPNIQGIKQDVTNSDHLSLVDGGTNGELMSFTPLLLRSREIDVIFALDISTDTGDSWPLGKALGVTQQRTLDNSIYKPFPHVPDDFIARGYTQRPTFFGCYPNLSDPDSVPPIVIYNSNRQIAGSQFWSNVSGETTKFTSDQTNELFKRGFDLFETADQDDWPACVACATVQRERERQSLARPTEQCQACFNKYCYKE